MYWESLKTGFLEVERAKEEGIEELALLAERCRERLCEMLSEEGSVILERYTACLDLLNRRRLDDKAVFEESERIIK